MAFAERLADDGEQIDPQEWAAIVQSLDDRRPKLNDFNSDRGLLQLTSWLQSAVAEDIVDESHEVVEKLRDGGADVSIPLALLRDIFSDELGPIPFDPAWRTGTAVALARGIYDDRAFDRMPILADALQDAGCEDAAVLDHCRTPGPHVRGCWVVDAVLGNE